MKRNKESYFEAYDEHGKTLVIRKTEKGIKNWIARNDIRRDPCGFHYIKNGKRIYIDYCAL